MPKAYSGDMRQRVIAEVEGGASRREAAEDFEVSASTAIMLSGDWPLRAQAAGRKHLAAGEARALSVGFDRATA
jgi:transposase